MLLSQRSGTGSTAFLLQEDRSCLHPIPSKKLCCSFPSRYELCLGYTRGSLRTGKLSTKPLYVARAVEAPGKEQREPQLKFTTDGSNFTSVPQIWSYLAQRHPDVLALSEPHNKQAVNLTYQECESTILQAAAGLASLGLRPSEPIALFAEASSRWILADQAAMTAGGIPVVRGSTASVDELAFILQNGRCQAMMIQEPEALARLLPALKQSQMGALKFIITVWGDVDESLKAAIGSATSGNGQHQPPTVLSWPQLLEQGRASMSQQPFTPAPCSPAEVATLVYTSGTTGQPTGVKLTHGNLAYQLNNLNHFLEVQPGEKLLSLLPPWHIYQRTVSYYVHSRAASVVFSNIRRFASDLQTVTPDHLVCVPLVLDTLHSRVMQKMRSAPPLRQKLVGLFLAISTSYIKARRVVEGMDLKYALNPRPLPTLLGAYLLSAFLQPLHMLATKVVWSKVREALGIRHTVISGGGSLAAHLDDFFEVIGLPVLNGWGLTETSPVLACRRAVQNVRGTVGHPVPGTELRVVQPDTLEPVAPGEAGVVLARGPGVTPGYVDNEAATAKAFRAGDGWFDTGDLGWQMPYGVPGSNMGGILQLTGRSKDTIVLINGKNVSPQPIEDMVCASTLVKHCLLFGQDRRELGALVFPDMDALEALLAERKATAAGATAAPTTNSTDASSNGASSSTNGNGAGHPLATSASPRELEDLFMAEIQRLEDESASPPEFRIARVSVVVSGSLTPEDGTLTQTMKPRKLAIVKKYGPYVDALMGQLRG
mmetsp:Transcript_18441/g.48095  ORF Transcript_18441/g.48095 Transcript_18441/m.48095 type:complete len:769 (-) Transcript_18441:1861-4167(-)